MTIQRPISSIVRLQPMHQGLRGSMVQTPMHGDTTRGGRGGGAIRLMRAQGFLLIPYSWRRYWTVRTLMSSISAAFAVEPPVASSVFMIA